MERDRTLPLAYVLRAVRTAVLSASATVVAMLAYLLLSPPDTVDRLPFLGVVAMAIAGTAFMGLRPWRRLHSQNRHMPWFYAWSAAYVVMIAAAIPMSGGPVSPMFLGFALTTVYFAILYPARAQIVLLAFTYICYVTALALSGSDIEPGRLTLQLAALGILAGLAGALSREVFREMREHEASRRVADRRAALLETVGRAVRSVSALDSERVLEAMIQGTTQLGYEAATLTLNDEDGETYVASHAVGLPEEYVRSRHLTAEGIVGMVREGRRVVALDDYSSHPRALPALRDMGFRAVIAAPVWVQGRLAATLVAGTRDQREFRPEEVEAFELLAGVAGRALENARAFEDERRTVERLGELDRLKSDFLSTVSHELRTPLTVVSGMGLTLEDRWDHLDDDLRKELLGRLNANAKTLDRIIGSLLDFSRLEAGRMEVHLNPVDVSSLVKDVVSRLDELFRDHTLVVDVPDGLVASADPVLMDRVVENLLSNAVNHTPPGTQVTLRAWAENGAIGMSVADEGPGIPRESLEHLGDRFFRGGDPNTRRVRGTGLGLALVREILRLHGAELEVQSVVGGGTRFRFHLPVDASVPAEKESGNQAPNR